MFLNRDKGWWAMRIGLYAIGIAMFGAIIGISALDKKSAVDFDCEM